MLINIPWTVHRDTIAALAKRGLEVVFPTFGGISLEFEYDTDDGEIHRASEFAMIPYDIESYPGVYWGGPRGYPDTWLQTLSPYYIIESFGFSWMLPNTWRKYLYLMGFPEFFGQADPGNIEQVLEHGDFFVNSEAPFVLTLHESTYGRKEGTYIGTEHEETYEDSDFPVLNFQFHLLGQAPWREKWEAVVALMQDNIASDIDLGDIEWETLEPWTEQVVRRLEEQGTSLEEETKRLREIWEK